MPQHLPLASVRLINKHRYILRKLATSSIKQRRIILKNAPNELFKTLHVVFKLLSDGKLDISKKNENKIKKHKTLIRSTSRLNAKSIKAKLVKQQGGALPAILSSILPILGTVVKALL